MKVDKQPHVKSNKYNISVTVTEKLIVVKVFCWLVDITECTASFETGEKDHTWARARWEHNVPYWNVYYMIARVSVV